MASSSGLVPPDSSSRGGQSSRRLGRRLPQLYVGLFLYGSSAAFMVRSKLGLDPWDVFHQGVAQRLHVPMGLVLNVVGAIVLLGWIPLRQRPGLGTVSNVLLVGTSLSASLPLLPSSSILWVRVVYLVVGVVLCGIATGMYIGAEFGPGPRDGLMTGLPRYTHMSIRLTRTLLELTVLLVGWLLGGTVGIGTVLFAVCIGPLAQVFLRVFALDRPARAATVVDTPVAAGDEAVAVAVAAPVAEPSNASVDG